MNHLASNLKFLRENLGKKQDEMQAGTGIKGATWSNYELGKTEPPLDIIISLSKFFKMDLLDLILKDLRKDAYLTPKDADNKKSNLSHLISHVTTPLITKKQATPIEYKQELIITMTGEGDDAYDKKNRVIPITDLSVAAGAGIYAPAYIENVEAIRLPIGFLKKNATYLTVRIKGDSMSPTLQDSGYAIIRLLENGEWDKMPDERIYAVSDIEGKTSLKRVKNRFKQKFITLMSDNPDKASYPNFNLQTNEINTIWYMEWYFSAKMPNIHDQYYSRLQRLEDKVEELFKLPKPK